MDAEETASELKAVKADLDAMPDAVLKSGIGGFLSTADFKALTLANKRMNKVFQSELEKRKPVVIRDGQDWRAEWDQKAASKKVGSLSILGDMYRRVVAEILRMFPNVSSVTISSPQESFRIPDELASMPNLRRLRINDAIIPKNGLKGIGKLTQLEKLELETIDTIETLPDEIGKLTNLVELTVTEGGLTGLPKTIGDLKSLRILDVSDNMIEHLPEEVGKLTNLVELDANHNYLMDVPAELGNLKNLVELWLDVNNLETLPEELAKLTKLQVLDAENNPIERVPDIVLRMPALQWGFPEDDEEMSE